MLQFWGTLAISVIGGSFLLHFLKNFYLKEKRTFTWDWDGMIERFIVTYLLISVRQFLYLIPIVIFIKIIFRIGLIGFETFFKINEPGTVFQKIKTKANLAFDLIISPAFAILIGVILK